MASLLYSEVHSWQAPSAHTESSQLHGFPPSLPPSFWNENKTEELENKVEKISQKAEWKDKKM